MPQPDFSPAADRNKQHILEVLLACLPTQGHALEIASGTGQHVARFAAAMPHWTWQPTDAQPNALQSISAWTQTAGMSNVLDPMLLDVMTTQWLPAVEKLDLIYCANMLHISPWATCAALMRGSVTHLKPGGVLITYGPYLENEITASEGNIAFDQSLRMQDASWGIRRREDVEREAHLAGLKLSKRHAMPANNLLLVWARA